MDDVLIGIRVVHFASTLLLGGVLMFRLLAAGPAWRGGGARLPGVDAFDRRFTQLVCMSLAIAVASGAAWFLILSADIADRSVLELFSDNVAWIVLTETRFGHAWIARLIMAALIAVGTVWLDRLGGRRSWRVASAVMAGGLLGTLAMSGHAGAAPGLRGDIHLLSDALHLVAAGAWLGGLLPLALLLAFANRADDPARDAATVATRRFSRIAIASVATLVVTGIINSLILVERVEELLTTTYGRLLLAKIVVFIAMLCIAAVNLLRLTPRLPDRATMRQLTRNTLIETGLGLVVIVIVGALGITAPGTHEAPHVH